MRPLCRPQTPAPWTRALWSLLLLAVAGCAGQQQDQTAASAPDHASSDSKVQCNQVGIASWYRGSSRDRASPRDLVAAHRSLPFGTVIVVTALDTGQSVVVRINDRGPFGWGRIIDLSRTAADQLGILRDGVARVRLEPVGAVGEACPFLSAGAD